jgi:hypothetical protein
MTGKGNSREWGDTLIDASVDAPRSGAIVTHSELMNTARSLVREGHGILAADESLPTLAKRFAAIGIPSTAETRGAYRDMLISAVGIEQSIRPDCSWQRRQRTAEGVAARERCSPLATDRAMPCTGRPFERPIGASPTPSRRTRAPHLAISRGPVRG